MIFFSGSTRISDDPKILMHMFTGMLPMLPSPHRIMDNLLRYHY